MESNYVIERLKSMILHRLKVEENEEISKICDARISRLLNKTKTYIATCKHRDIIPYESIVEFCLREGYSLEYVFGGDKEEQSD